MRQRSFLPPHHTSSGRDSQPRGRLYLQGLGEESRGMCSRFVILQVETPDESESRLSAISVLFFFFFGFSLHHWTDSADNPTICKDTASQSSELMAQTQPSTQARTQIFCPDI